ncbi:MAG: hypothetical protein DRG25_03750 [Deltaproteobacteria bacterium]|nr:MAG: hypothetical protein DRG25_03750 [Deltaproteobacteria bacterium]
MSEDRLSLNLYGVIIELSFEDREAKERIKHYFRPFLKDSSSPHHVFEIGKKSIRIDEALVNGFHQTSPLLLEEVIFYINVTFWREVKGYLVIHSGAVKKGRKTLFFPGYSGSGKSTLVFWFFINGWEYLSDDLISIEFRSKRICPYPIPLRLKNPPMKISRLLEKISDIRLDFFAWGDESFYYLQPRKSFKEPLWRPEDRYVFIFPHYSPGENFSFRKLNTKETFTQLISHCINFSSHQKEAFELIFNLVEKVAGYDLIYGKFEQIEATRLDEEVFN